MQQKSPSRASVLLIFTMLTVPVGARPPVGTTKSRSESPAAHKLFTHIAPKLRNHNAVDKYLSPVTYLRRYFEHCMLSHVTINRDR